MALWNCMVCGGEHDSDTVGYKCPHQNKRKYMNDNKLKIERFYNTKKWQHTKDYVRYRDKYCMRCYTLHDRYTFDGLEVHHIHKLETNWNKRLDKNNLVLLCKQCHRYTDTQCKDGELDFKFVPKPPEFKIHGI